MSALVTLAYPMAGFNLDPMFAIVSDEEKVIFVYPEGSEAIMNIIIPAVAAEGKAMGANTPSRWLQIASARLNHIRFTRSTPADDFDSAMEQANQLLAPFGTTTQEQGR